MGIRFQLLKLLKKAQMMKKEMEPVGLMKNPYPFYDGVEPKAK